MARGRHFIMRWPELGISVECEPLEYNRGIYDWWLDHMPIKAVQSHAAVTGEVFYTLNIRLPEPAPTFAHDELKIDLMTSAPEGYGQFGYNERGGLSGWIGLRQLCVKRWQGIGFREWKDFVK